MSILAKIIEHKRTEVEADKQSIPQNEIEREALSLSPRGFVNALKCYEKPSIIAEVKKASPSRGIIREDLSPVTTAMSYAVNGAACISVLTERKFFLGDLGYLAQIRDAVTDTPLIRKDFIIDPYQVYQTRAAGADAILLVASVLDEVSLKELFFLSLDLDLDVLLEVHDKAEMKRALSLFERTSSDLASRVVLGINNRDLTTFETDLSVSIRLIAEFAAQLEKLGVGIVSESGIECAEDIASLEAAGVLAYLIGESLVRKGDPGENLQALIKNTQELLK